MAFVAQVALLHDTVEDTDTTLEELNSRFGAEVAGIVAEVTDDKSLDKAQRKELQVMHAAHASHKARLVKLADKLYNLRDLERCTPVGWAADRVQQYYEWAARVCRQMRGTCPQLELALTEILARHNITF